MGPHFSIAFGEVKARRFSTFNAFELMHHNLKCYLADHLEETPPQGFNTVALPVDLSLTASLNFDTLKERCNQLNLLGYKLFFHLNFAIEGGLLFPINDRGQLNSFILALNCFKEAILEPFSSATEGVILYQGPLKGSSTERDEFLDFFRALLIDLPDQLPPFLLLDISKISTPYHFFELGLSLKPFSYALKGEWQERYPCALGVPGWETASPYGFFGKNRVDLPEKRKCPVAVILPKENERRFQDFIDSLKEPFRIITFSDLAETMEGLERLIVFKGDLLLYEKRLLDGFEAALGEILYI